MFQLQDIHDTKIDINTIISINAEAENNYMRIRIKPTKQHALVTFQNLGYKNKEALWHDYNRLLDALAAHTNSHEY